jgi:hypothetical protein
VAGKRKLEFVDLFLVTRWLAPALGQFNRWTDNGIHLSGPGYQLTSILLKHSDLQVSTKLPSDGSPESRRELAQQEAKWHSRARFSQEMQHKWLAESEPLRAKIVAKNRLFFHRWRPQNETYLFGFRKHEQGVNGKEVAEFDPLVAAAEKEIASLREQVKGQKEK